MLKRVDVKFFKLAVGQEAIGRETDVDINARCPICGDSQKKKTAKRLHLYNKGEVTNVNCFNGDCSCQNKTVYTFLRDFFPALIEQYKRETFTGTMKNLASGNESGDAFGSFKKEPETPNPEQAEVIIQELSPYLTKIEDKPEAIQYLLNRGIEYNENYGQWYFGHQDLKIGETLYPITNNIVIPLYYNGEMYGFYSRSIFDKQFYTYMNDANIGYKIWNWFNIDKRKPVYIFEGIFDAISSGKSNIIAAIGAKIPQDRINELAEPIFCYDNDRTGLMNALQMARKGFKVYVQPLHLSEKDMNDLKLKHPTENIPLMIDNNLYQGISAEIRIKQKL